MVTPTDTATLTDAATFHDTATCPETPASLDALVDEGLVGGSVLDALDNRELAVLAVLLANRNRVLSRSELTRLSGLHGLSERRCDGLLVGIRRVLGPDSIRTVRGRGWILDGEAAGSRRIGDRSFEAHPSHGWWAREAREVRARYAASSWRTLAR